MTPNKAITILARLSKCRTENCPEELHCGECNYGVSVDDCVEAFDVAVEALKNFPTQMSGTSANNSEIPNSSDLISRQAALDVILPYCPDDDGTCSKSGDDLRNLLDDIENLPSIQSERKKGHWIEIALSNHTYKCSVCGRLLVNITDGKNNVTKNYPYCHCGADMRGDQNDDSE